MFALGEHIDGLVAQYNSANVHRTEREMLYTRDPGGGFGVGETGMSGPTRSVYRTADPDSATIAAEWRFAGDQAPGNRKVDLSVVVIRNGEVVVSSGRSRYRDIDSLCTIPSRSHSLSR
jgi:hypothetical protein